jgi:integrase
MPRAAKPLTDVRIKSAKPDKTEVRLYDGAGLYLSVMPNGARWWRLKYQFAGKECRIGLGCYPEVGLAEARHRREKARAQIRNGIDPGQKKRDEKAAATEAAANTFRVVANEWLDRRLGKGGKTVAEITALKNRWMIDTYAMPALGPRPIKSILARDVLAVLREVESTNKLETARRLKINLGQIFRFAILDGRADIDPTAPLVGALKAPNVKHHASITDPKRIGELLRAIDGYNGQPATHAALKLAPLVFVRPSELRGAEWNEIDLDGAEWRIPASRMKMDEKHIVPLSRQAVALLRELRPYTGSGKYVFPSIRSMQRPISENTVNGALRRLGYSKDEMTGHGFRSMASTLLNEQGWHRDAIERQLAHGERDKVRAAYNYAEHLPERIEMMQAWADYLDKLRASTDAVRATRKRQEPGKVRLNSRRGSRGIGKAA